MRTLLRKLLTVLLVLSLMPGWMEILENVEHLAHDGHLAHLGGHDDSEDVASHEALQAEHGCTPVSHTCGCHVSAPAILPDAFSLAQRMVIVLRERPTGLEDHPIYRANAPPVPPPRA